MKLPIKVGFLVSYDYEKLKHSLPPVYEHADKIVLAIDKNRKTWAGNIIQIVPQFFEWIKEIDIKNKIELFEDDFFVEGLSAMECETRERQMLASYLGKGGWHIQIDADEYFVDFCDFVSFLHMVEPKSHSIIVKVEDLLLFKKTSNGYLLVKGSGGYFPIATTNPVYTIARAVKGKKTFYYPQRIIHDSWARNEDELLDKLNNWGHKNDFDINGYYNFWSVINEQNYKFFKNFHPLVPIFWNELSFVEGENIFAIQNELKQNTSLLIAHNKKKQNFQRIFNLLCPPIFIKLYEKICRRLSL